MARNRIQFQKGRSEAQFQVLYGNDESAVRIGMRHCLRIGNGNILCRSER